MIGTAALLFVGWCSTRPEATPDEKRALLAKLDLPQTPEVVQVRTDDAYFKATTKANCAGRYPTDFTLRGACTRNAREGLRSYIQIWNASRDVPSFNDALKQCYANYTRGDVTDFSMVGAPARNQVDGLRETEN